MTAEAARPLPPEVLDAVKRYCFAVRARLNRAFPSTPEGHIKETEHLVRAAHADLTQAVALLDRARRPAGVEDAGEQFSCPMCVGNRFEPIDPAGCQHCGGTGRLTPEKGA